MQDLKKYLKIIIPGISLNLFAALLYDASKLWLQNIDYRLTIFIVSVLIFNLVYSIFLIKFVQSIEKEKFIERTKIHHAFAHTARNIAVKLMEKKPPLPNPVSNEHPVPLSGELHYAFEGDLVLLLRSLADIFAKLVPPGTKIWTCLRERRTDEHYHTILRAGNFNPSRVEFSTPLSKNSKTIENLRYSYEKKMDCVWITGSNRPDLGWEKIKNDEFQEDLSVLMGAVLSKSWTGRDFDDPMLNWVLCVCADRENVFNKSHIPLMKCCNDIFSWLVNSFIRHDAVLNRHAISTTVSPDNIEKKGLSK